MVITETPSVRELLDIGAEKYGNSTFIKYIENGETREKSFIQIRNDSRCVCRMIRHIAKNKINIAIIGKTSYEYLVFASGVLISGNVSVPFSPEISVAEAAELFERADIEMLLYEEAFADKAKELLSICPDLKNIVSFGSADEIYERYSETSEFSGLSEFEEDKEQSAIIIYTSGTTGVKKGVVLSMNALVGNIMYQEYCTDIFNEGVVALSVLPMYHTFCFSGDYIKNLKDGLQVCLNGEFKDIAENLKRFQPKVIRIVPMIAQSLLGKIKILLRRNPDLTPRQAAEEVYGKNIKWLISGGAYLNPELVEEYDKLGIFLRQGYGMTEAGCRISVPDDGVAYESVGRIIDLCDVRIENGEIQVKTPTVMTGYYKMPEETKEMFTDDGWLKTGDIGYVTEDRQLFITGRVKNLIILSSGENVSPEAIERKFSAMDLVEEVLVYGEGNRIIAEVYPNSEYAEANGIDDIEAELEKAVDSMNETAKASHIISEVRVRNIPFEKTGPGKIKRYETKI
ncbi:MAG: AMP-binding protein [Acutalibacteraceae bacterium]|nr:AMP-binding protein [Acutalibacteraceae bacterium]